jgi:hypothetical protein
MTSGDLNIKQNPLPEPRECPWHKRYTTGKVFSGGEIFPSDCCPWLYNILYSYFLGLQYGAAFAYNEQGDCHVGCPAKTGVDTVVRKRPYEDGLDPRITDKRPVIYADVVAVHGNCHYKHKVGQRILYPLCMNSYYMCPAGFHSIFPLLQLTPPSCIDLKEIRCPDWADTVTYDISGEEK